MKATLEADRSTALGQEKTDDSSAAPKTAEEKKDDSSAAPEAQDEEKEEDSSAAPETSPPYPEVEAKTREKDQQEKLPCELTITHGVEALQRSALQQLGSTTEQVRDGVVALERLFPRHLQLTPLPCFLLPRCFAFPAAGTAGRVRADREPVDRGGRDEEGAALWRLPRQRLQGLRQRRTAQGEPPRAAQVASQGRCVGPGSFVL
jgi:hypothetical protein